MTIHFAMADHAKTGHYNCVTCNGEMWNNPDHQTPLGCPLCESTEVRISYDVVAPQSFFVKLNVDGEKVRDHDNLDSEDWYSQRVFCPCGWSVTLGARGLEEAEMTFAEAVDLMVEVPFVDPEEKAAIDGLNALLDSLEGAAA